MLIHSLLSFRVKYRNSYFSSNKTVLEPSSYHKTQLIILYTNQLHTKTLANLHSGVLALTREPHIQTIYLSNVYSFCWSSEIYYHVFFYLIIFFTLPISKSWLPEHYKDIYHTVYIFIKMLHPFSKCMNVFNLREDAVNCCKALIWVYYDLPPPHAPHPPSIFTYSLFPRDRERERERFGCFTTGPHPHRKSEQTAAIVHEGEKKMLTFV